MRACVRACVRMESLYGSSILTRRALPRKYQVQIFSSVETRERDVTVQKINEMSIRDLTLMLRLRLEITSENYPGNSGKAVRFLGNMGM